MANQKCVTTIFFTAGESFTSRNSLGGPAGDAGDTYMKAREHGNEVATALMAGVADQYTEFSATFGGQPVLIRTLVGAPQVQKVWFRLPDGNMDGSGFSTSSYQSLRALYFGSISQITNKPGTASYTLNTLKQAVGEILSARKPDYVRTLDYMSDYDAGDHADHLTTARIIRDLVGQYAPNAGLAGYMGYPVQNFAPTMSTSSAAFKAKTAAFFAYTPYDNAECQAYSDCASAGRGEAYWLVRQYVVTPELAQHSTYGTASNPVTLPNSTNIANLATPQCSSETVWQPCSAAIDRIVSGYPANYSAEWATVQETTSASITLTWPDPYNITAFALHDRINLYDWITGGTLTFADGSATSFGALANEGSATLVQLDTPVVTDSVTLTVTSVGDQSSSVGLAEIRAYGAVCKGCPFTSAGTATTVSPAGILSGTGAYADLALQATATASSWSSVQPPDRAIDGVISGYSPSGKSNYSAEWATDHETVGAWLNLTWPAYYMIDSLVLYDRPNLDDWITGAHIDFDDGTSLTVPALKNDMGATVLNFTAVNASSLQMTVTSTGEDSTSIGLAEIVASYSQAQTPVNITTPLVYVPQNQTVNPNSTSAIPIIDSSNNIARQATATASSNSDNQLPESAIDGIIDGYKENGSGSWMDEWASDHEGVGAWLLLTWPKPVTITQVVLYDRPNLSDRILKGNFTYSDGTGRSFGALNADGSATAITLAQAITTTTLKITVTQVSSTTNSIGLSEVVVYGGQAADISNLSPIIANATNNGTYNNTLNATISGYSGSFSVPIPTASYSGNLNVPASSPFSSAYRSDKSAVPTASSSGALPGYSGSGNSSVGFSSGTQSSTAGPSAPVITSAPSASGFLPSGLASFASGAASGFSSIRSQAASGVSSLASAGGSIASSLFAGASSIASSAVPVATAGVSGIVSNATSAAASFVSSAASAVPTAFNSGASASSPQAPASLAAAQASASQAAQASASQAAAQSLSSVYAASVASASLASIASVSGASAASVASVSAVSVSAASASVYAASVASASQMAAASSASVASASAYAASVASASAYSASVASASAYAKSVAAASSGAAASAASVASASSASVASVSALSASLASVASVSRASVSSALAASATMVTSTKAPAPSGPVPPSPPSKPATTSSTGTPTITAAANVNIAPSASATASSWRSTSPPDGIIDNTVGGLSLLGFGNPGDEWATSARTLPSWVELKFPQPYLIRSMQLFGPVNINNGVLSGFISFSDNTKINFNSLTSSGTWIDLGPAGKASTTVRITITNVNLSAKSVGLAEVKIFSSPHACGLLDWNCVAGAFLPLK
ncbi:hypothetical protein OIO90_005033 [Microbotryomycetes sp. JL221]|nr:hypothetical protein OIO90_005033 [Microbotryomycetes sp. JL221]